MKEVSEGKRVDSFIASLSVRGCGAERHTDILRSR